jgi:hypothetical protein
MKYQYRKNSPVVDIERAALNPGPAYRFDSRPRQSVR